MYSEFFTIESRTIIPGEWGDYGNLLQNGMTARLRRTDGNSSTDRTSSGKLSLERTGPFIPPITLPGIRDVVVTNEARHLLEASGLTGFGFRPVEMRLIVDLPRHTWDLGAEEPPVYPDSGEPEGYILGQPHSPSVASAMGEIWEVIVPFNVTIVRPSTDMNSHPDRSLDTYTWDGSDLLRTPEYGGVLCSKRAKDWLSRQWSQYLYFTRFSARWAVKTLDVLSTGRPRQIVEAFHSNSRFRSPHGVFSLQVLRCSRRSLFKASLVFHAASAAPKHSRLHLPRCIGRLSTLHRSAAHAEMVRFPRYIGSKIALHIRKPIVLPVMFLFFYR